MVKSLSPKQVLGVQLPFLLNFYNFNGEYSLKVKFQSVELTVMGSTPIICPTA